MTQLRVACAQMRGGIEITANIKAASTFITEAAGKGAQLIATPEMTNLVDLRPGMARSKITPEAGKQALAHFCTLASEHSIWLLIGSLAIALEDDERFANRSVLIDPVGKVAAVYDKIHMFDVAIGDGQTYRESRAYKPGKTAILAKTFLTNASANIGMTICYDLRFPALYRALAHAGADIITCPAAFTQVTGAAHWHTLLRARAIETGAFILAPAQGGTHEDGRHTYGHSLIISPWGEIVAERENDTPGLLMADIDLDEVAKARTRLPSLSHDRAFTVKSFAHPF